MKQVFAAWFCLVVSFAPAAEAPSAKFGTMAVGTDVPSFTLMEVGGKERSVGGKANGGVVVVSMMGTNRSPGAVLESVFSRYRDQGVTVIGVCAGATREEFEVWRAKHTDVVSYPLMWDPAGRDRAKGIGMKVFGIGTYPMTLVMDKAGKLTGGFVGFGPTAGTLLNDYLRTAGLPIPVEEEPKRLAPPPTMEDRTLKPGDAAPDFTSVTLKGQAVKLSDYAGKVVVLDFWATWCGPCIEAMPHTQKAAAAMKSQGAVILAACTSDTRKRFEAWVSEHGSKYPDLIFTNDPNGRDGPAEKYAERASTKLYGVTGIPCQFVIGRDGKIVEVIRGFGPGDKRLEETLAKLGVKIAP